MKPKKNQMVSIPDLKFKTLQFIDEKNKKKKEMDNKPKPCSFVVCIMKYIFIVFDIVVPRKADGC